jgi:hypothetical protein
MELFVTDKHCKRTQQVIIPSAFELKPSVAVTARNMAFGHGASVYVQDADGPTRYSVNGTGSKARARRCDL